MLTSQRKHSRSNLLKTNAKHSVDGKQRVESTGLGMSVRFRQQRQAQQVREFTEDLPGGTGTGGVLPGVYSRGELLKDVNYLNSIYNHVLVMISSHLVSPADPKNHQLAKMSRQIETLILENVEVKAQIDGKYRSMLDLQQISQHLGITATELAHGHGRLEDFFGEFEQKEELAQRLSSQLQQMETMASTSKYGGVSSAKIEQKQKKCKALRKVIDRQRQKISKLQQEQKLLLRKLYDTQRQILKNEHSSSAIKLKLKQAQSEKRIRSKTREPKPEGKENLPSANKQKERKSVKVDAERVKLIRRH